MTEAKYVFSADVLFAFEIDNSFNTINPESKNARIKRASWKLNLLKASAAGRSTEQIVIFNSCFTRPGRLEKG